MDFYFNATLVDWKKRCGSSKVKKPEWRTAASVRVTGREIDIDIYHIRPEFTRLLTVTSTCLTVRSIRVRLKKV